MNESYAICFYLEVSAPLKTPRVTQHDIRVRNIMALLTSCRHNESFSFLLRQGQFKSQGNKLIPDDPGEQARMYQRMFEALTFYDKLSESCKISKQKCQTELLYI